jgi:outer membrane lipopolysaccharide assembly protein LptE/RlpB
MNETALLILIAILLVAVVGLIVALFVAIRKLLTVDDLLESLSYDIAVNVKYFDKLLTTPLYENSTEVKAAHQNMNIMKLRLEEFSLRIQESTGSTPDERQED